MNLQSDMFVLPIQPNSSNWSLLTIINAPPFVAMLGMCFFLLHFDQKKMVLLKLLHSPNNAWMQWISQELLHFELCYIKCFFLQADLITSLSYNHLCPKCIVWKVAITTYRILRHLSFGIFLWLSKWLWIKHSSGFPHMHESHNAVMVCVCSSFCESTAWWLKVEIYGLSWPMTWKKTLNCSIMTS